MTDLTPTNEEIASIETSAEGPRASELPPRARRPRSVRSLDFERPLVVGPAEQRRFERAHMTFCVDAAEELTEEIGTPIALEVIDCSQRTWRTALADVPPPSVSGVVRCPGGGALLLSIEQDLIQRMIERMLGGSYETSSPIRELTEIDLALARSIFARTIARLSTCWEELLGVQLGLLGFDLENTPLERIPPFEPALSLTIEARDRVAGSTLVLLVPKCVLDAAPRALADGSAAGPEHGPGRATPQDLRGALGPVSVKVRAEIGGADLTLADVLKLAVGDLVPLGSAGAAVIAAGRDHLHYAKPGARGKRRAVQVVEPVVEER